MSSKILIISDKKGGFDLYRDNLILATGLTHSDIKGFYDGELMLKATEQGLVNADLSEFGQTTSPPNPRPIKAGRPPELIQHAGLVRAMIAKNKDVTANDISQHFHSVGIESATPSKIKSVARYYEIKLKN